jgi:hypothetical protein
MSVNMFKKLQYAVKWGWDQWTPPFVWTYGCKFIVQVQSRDLWLLEACNCLSEITPWCTRDGHNIFMTIEWYCFFTAYQKQSWTRKTQKDTNILKSRAKTVLRRKIIRRLAFCWMMHSLVNAAQALSRILPSDFLITVWLFLWFFRVWLL